MSLLQGKQGKLAWTSLLRTSSRKKSLKEKEMGGDEGAGEEEEKGTVTAISADGEKACPCQQARTR